MNTNFGERSPLTLFDRSMCASLAVDVERKGALALYKSLGFEIQSTRQDYYKAGRHAHCLELNFTAP